MKIENTGDITMQNDLSVNGNIRVVNNSIRLQNADSNFAGEFRKPITKSNSSDIEQNEINGSIGSNDGSTAYDAGFLRLSAGGGTSVANKSYIDLYGYNSNLIALGTKGTERMVISSDGNVGIGTTNPSAKLDVNGSLSLRDNDNGEYLAWLRFNG